MFRAKTVLVLGAGASAEVGLPIGDRLLESIRTLLDFSFEFNKLNRGDPVVASALKSVIDEGREVTIFNQHMKAAHQIRDSAQLGLSIDNVVDGLEDEKVTRVAKLAIARAIHLAEDASDFFKVNEESRNLQFSNFLNTWYGKLTKLLTENCRRSNIEKIFDNLSIISFNYDRCLERYLPDSIAYYYGLPVDEVREIFREVPFHRPYGAAGELPWRQRSGCTAGFGKVDAQKLLEVSAQIKTFSEQIEAPETLDVMRKDIAEADRLVFLGSAFHRQNLELLRSKVKPTAQILATASGVSFSDRGVIKVELADTLGVEVWPDDSVISLDPIYCNEFFQDRWRTLTADPPLD